MTIIYEDFLPDELELLPQIDLTRIPRHVAIIMDGNGRWATRQGLPRAVGHHAGTQSLRKVVKASRGLGIEYLTLYSFSTENWLRPDSEVHALMALIEETLRIEADYLFDQGVRVHHLGRTQELPESLRATLRETMARTAGNTRMQLVLAINYSGRTEIRDVVRDLAAAAVAGTLDPAAISEADVSQAMYLPALPDPELLIRTAGEMRVSNYLLWQIAYAEFWSTPVLWPDFRGLHLLQAVAEYQARQRTFGRVE